MINHSNDYLISLNKYTVSDIDLSFNARLKVNINPLSFTFFLFDRKGSCVLLLKNMTLESIICNAGKNYNLRKVFDEWFSWYYYKNKDISDRKILLHNVLRLMMDGEALGDFFGRKKSTLVKMKKELLTAISSKDSINFIINNLIIMTLEEG